MNIAELSVRRPVFAAVMSLLIIVAGVMSFLRLPVRELPDIDPPIVSIDTTYPGASADIVETRVTQLLESRISGIEGIKTVTSSSRDGRSQITIEFSLSRDIEAAANDVRNAVSRALGNLPEEVDPPEVSKVDADSDVIVWYNLTSTTMNLLELTEYADRYLVDRLSVIDGVARVNLGGGQRYAIRIWLDRRALAARGLTVNDVEAALRRENIELPAGRLESTERNFTVRVQRGFTTPTDFAELTLTRGSDGHIVRLGEVAQVEFGPSNPYVFFQGNGTSQIGLGIIKQSQANTVAVVEATTAEILKLRETLPEGTELHFSYDSSVFIAKAIEEVYFTLFIAIMFVVGVIYFFLGSFRAALIPAVTVPVCILGTFFFLDLFGLSLNLITLLALVLAIGLVVDDAIIVLENVQRRIDLHEPPVVAAAHGTRQVMFAVLATTIVLITVFVPIAFLQGNIGRLFSELAISIAGAVAISAFVALTLSAMMTSNLLRPRESEGIIERATMVFTDWLGRGYGALLKVFLRHSSLALMLFAGVIFTAYALYTQVPSELAPNEDRGSFFINITGPEGQSFEETVKIVKQAEAILMELVTRGEASRVLVRAPASFGSTEDFNGGFGTVMLVDWDNRQRSTDDIIQDMTRKLSVIPGARVLAFARQGFGGGRGGGQPVQFVLGGTSYEELAQWRDRIIARASENENIIGLDSDLRETKPQFRVEIDRDRAADLGVSVQVIGRTLETMLGSRQVTTYIDRGEEYDVVLQGQLSDRRSPRDLTNIFVKSERTGALIPLSNLVTLNEVAAPSTLNRFNRLRSVTLSAGLAPGYPLGEALKYLERIAHEELPVTAQIDYKGQSRELKEAGSEIITTFALALVIVFLVLAAQFESFVHPFIIILTVPLAVTGALYGLWISGSSLNIYSQIGIVMLIGLATKNGILIVEFANQLRDEGRSIRDAVTEAALIRLRPILMTNISTAMGALPLVLAGGAGAASRFTIGMVVFAGVIVATLLSLFIIPVMYDVFARYSRPTGRVGREIEAWEHDHPKGVDQAPAE
ncbi:MAG: efflux RND transporter permease subunit [Alphaproteobacteria bacterium]|nr:efflux RND transporter permease subunit [Alphaproteobacteria bacterium]